MDSRYRTATVVPTTVVPARGWDWFFIGSLLLVRRCFCQMNRPACLRRYNQRRGGNRAVQRDRGSQTRFWGLIFLLVVGLLVILLITTLNNTNSVDLVEEMVNTIRRLFQLLPIQTPHNPLLVKMLTFLLGGIFFLIYDLIHM